VKTGERIFFPFFFLFRFIRDDDFIFKIIKKRFHRYIIYFRAILLHYILNISV